MKSSLLGSRPIPSPSFRGVSFRFDSHPLPLRDKHYCSHPFHCFNVPFVRRLTFPLPSASVPLHIVFLISKLRPFQSYHFCDLLLDSRLDISFLHHSSSVKGYLCFPILGQFCTNPPPQFQINSSRSIPFPASPARVNSAAATVSHSAPVKSSPCQSFRLISFHLLSTSKPFTSGLIRVRSHQTMHFRLVTRHYHSPSKLLAYTRVVSIPYQFNFTPLCHIPSLSSLLRYPPLASLPLPCPSNLRLSVPSLRLWIQFTSTTNQF